MKMTKTPKLSRQATFIGELDGDIAGLQSTPPSGRATATPVPSLPDGPAQSAQLLALGNMARAPGQPTMVSCVYVHVHVLFNFYAKNSKCSYS